MNIPEIIGWIVLGVLGIFIILSTVVILTAFFLISIEKIRQETTFVPAQKFLNILNPESQEVKRVLYIAPIVPFTKYLAICVIHNKKIK